MLLRISREGKAMELMRKVDAHSADVAMKVYATTTAEDDARLGKYLHEELFGEPVEWPSSETLKSHDAPDLSQELQLVLVEDTKESDSDDDREEEEEPEDDEEDFMLTVYDLGHTHAEKGKNGSKVANTDTKKRKYVATTECMKAIDDKTVNIEARSSVDQGTASVKWPSAPDQGPTRGRKTTFTPQQKEWIIDQLPRWELIPTNQEARDIVADGVANGILDEGADFEKVRHVLRTTLEKKQTRL